MANLTTPTDVDPHDWIATVQPERRRLEAGILLPFFERVTGLPACLWGKDLVGFGRYHYRYESGREGDMFMTGFSPRKAAISIYVMPGYRDLGEPLTRLGPHRLGKSCLYITRLDAVELDALTEIVRAGVDHLRANYETADR